MNQDQFRTSKDSKIENILSAAEALIIEKSVDSITTTSIATRAGITRTALYHFFPSKTDVLNELSKRYYEQLRARLIDFFEGETNDGYRQAWGGVTGAVKEYFDTMPAASRLLLGEKDGLHAFWGHQDAESQLADDLSQLMMRHTDLLNVSKTNTLDPDLFLFSLRLIITFFSTGVRKYGIISTGAHREAKKAAIAYMDANIAGS